MADLTGLPQLPVHYRLTPEFKLLAACSWVAPPTLEQVQAERITSLCAAGIDWAHFIFLVDRHRVPALVHRALRRHACGRFPDDIRDVLKERSDQARKQALLHAAELVRLSRIFSGQGIEVVPLKGVILSLQLFGDSGTRQSKDIDLRIRPEDLVRADRLLALEGYRCTFPGIELTDIQIKYLSTCSARHFEYVHGTLGINIELHWRSQFCMPHQFAELWQGCRSMYWMGIRINCLENDNLLLYLCDHGASHKWFRIKWLSDIAMMLTQDRPDGWSGLPAMADRLGLRRALAQTMLLVHWLYDIPLPAPLRRLIQDEKTALSLGSAALLELQSNVSDNVIPGRRLEGVRQAIYQMRLKPSQPYGMFLKELMISPADLKQFPLPDSLFWLYIPLRPVLWFWRNYLKKSFAKTAR